MTFAVKGLPIEEFADLFKALPEFEAELKKSG